MANSFGKGATLEAQKAAGARPTGDTFYVDSVNGNDGNAGDRLHPVKTLTRAIALAAAGDRIVLNPGGSETVTATITVSVDDLEIICECAHPASGFTISGAGTLDLLTVSAADIFVSGLVFAHTGATANQSGVIIGATSHRATIRNCKFDDTAITTTFTGAGVEATSGADDVKIEACEFLDTQFGVLVAASGTNESDRLDISDCVFYVGRATSFGVRAAQATGKLQGPRIVRCLFVEANGAGAAATTAWDGTNGANATVGPISFGAAVDQYLVADCRAFTAAAVTFANLQGINAGAVGSISSSDAGTSIETSVDSVGTLVSTGNSSIVSYGVAGSTANSSGLSATVSLGVAGSTAHSSSLSAITSYGVAGSTANSSGLSATVSYGVAGSTANSSGLSATTSVGLVASSGLSAIQSYGTAGSTANSSGLSATVSYGVAGSTANSSGLSATTSVGVIASSGLSAIQSYGTAGSTANSSGLSATISYGVAGSTANSSALSATVSYGVAGSTANSSGLSATVSYGVAGSTAHSSSLSAATSVGVVVNAVGKPVSKVGSLADNALTNNTQVAGDTIATASGDVLIEDVIISKDATAFTGPTNIELTSDNVYGDTGVNDPVALISTATLAGTTRVAATGTSTWSTLKLPMVLESGKKLYLHGDDAAGTSAGNIRYAVIGRALSAGGSLT